MSAYIWVPADADAFARFAASGSTAYTYAEVIAAVADLDAAEAEYEQTYAAAWTLLEPYRDLYPGYIRWSDLLPAAHLALWCLMDSSKAPAGGRNGSRGSSEYFPIKKWAGIARSYRHLTRRINAAWAKALETERKAA